MAIAIIPQNADPRGDRKDWLSMPQADELICKALNKPVDKDHYYNNWFDNFYCFDWYNVKRTRHFKDDFAYDGFTTANDAILHMFKYHIGFIGSKEDIWAEVAKTQAWVSTEMEPIIRAIYDNGYKIVSLNIG